MERTETGRVAAHLHRAARPADPVVRCILVGRGFQSIEFCRVILARRYGMDRRYLGWLPGRMDSYGHRADALDGLSGASEGIMETTEAKLKTKLVEHLRKMYPGYVVLRHEDRFTFGIPDISVTGHGRTSWWEAKHANPDFESLGYQELTMLRLSAGGYARYIIWEEIGDVKRTLIVHPKLLCDWSSRHESYSVGFNHHWMGEQIQKVHCT